MDGDFSFMQSGLGAGLDVEPDVDTIRMIVSLMTILMEEAAMSGSRFAKACGRSSIDSRDIVSALKYEAHFFWEKDFDARFLERLQEERQHTYHTDDESDESEESGENGAEEKLEEMNDDLLEGYTDDLRDANEAEFHANVLRVCAEWSSWTPTDPAKRLLKNAIDKTERKFAPIETM